MNDVNIHASVPPTQAASKLFKSYVNKDAAASYAAEMLRDAMVNIVIANTSAQHRVDLAWHMTLMEEARRFAATSSIAFYKNDEYVCTYSFEGGDAQQTLKELQTFMSEVISRECVYEDIISYNEHKGFCWHHNGDKLAVVCD